MTVRLCDDAHLDTWQPILDGDSAARAVAIARAAADGLAGATLPPSLEHGDAGLAVMFAELANALGDPRDRERALAHLEAASAAVATRPLDASLFDGFTGVAWAADRIEALWPSDEDPCGDIDDALVALVERSPWSGTWDLASGLAGIAMYARGRLPRPAAARCLAAIVERIAEHDGEVWFVAPERVGAVERAEYPAGYHDLGVAHGIGGVLAVLSGCRTAGIAVGEPLLRDALAWLMERRRPEAHRASSASQFPGRISGGIGEPETRAGWCYGDPGLACMLVGVDAPLACELACAATRHDTLHVTNPWLCHGALGLGHMYNRLYQRTGDATLGAAARRWFTTAIERWPVLEPVPAFVTGAAGAVLALVAAATAVEPTWDRCMGLS